MAISVPALASDMFAAAASVLGTLVDRTVTAGEPHGETSDSSIRIDPVQLATVSHIPSAGMSVVIRYERAAFAHVVALMLGAEETTGEMDAMQLSIVAETLSQLSSAMAERVAAAAGRPSDGITSEVANDAGAFPAPPFESYASALSFGDRTTTVTIDFDGIALAKLGRKPEAPAPAPPPPAASSGRPPSAGQPVAFPTLAPTPIRSAPPGQANLDLVHDVPLEISAILGQTALSLRDVVALQAGSVFELDKLSTDPIDLYVNNILIARGEVVVVDEKFAVKISELNPNADKS